MPAVNWCGAVSGSATAILLLVNANSAAADDDFGNGSQKPGGTHRSGGQ